MKYEEAIAKLEQIARQLEQNELPIDQIASRLHEAQELVKYCQEQLTSVDEELKKITSGQQE
jgi:exodeoxyribonuclease VII small subunit